jgi:tetraacyldisaccharide 4'-kinase
VISVGNLTAGGSGKTPMVALLANHFLAQGKTPGILLRGYRAAAGAASDEAVLYQKLCPGARVEVGSDRAASARRAAAAGADVLLMDDGFQHLRLRRDLDIVLIDATSPWGGGNCIPGGLLREPVAALSGAGIVVVTRSDQVAPDALAALTARIRALAPAAGLFTARHAPSRLCDAGTGEVIPLERLRGQRVVLLSGIARPEAFAKTLVSLGAEVVAAFTGNDHQPFSPELLRAAFARAGAERASVVTTEKDAARGIPTSGAAPRWVLGVEQEVEGKEEFLETVQSAVNLRLRGYTSPAPSV